MGTGNAGSVRITKVFERWEKKYLISRDKCFEIRRALLECMDEDEFGLSTVCSLYYDTDDFRLIYNSIEKPLYKEKFRLRCYGVPDDDTQVFAEIKKKYDGIVYKRRVTAPYHEMMEFINGAHELERDIQIQREIRYMLARTKIHPACYVAYDRYALKDREGRDVRITFDLNARFRTYDLDLMKGDHGTPIEDNDLCIMEMKLGQGAPMWLVDVLNRMELSPGTYSKYGTVYKKHIFPKFKESAGAEVI